MDTTSRRMSLLRQGRRDIGSLADGVRALSRGLGNLRVMVEQDTLDIGAGYDFLDWLHDMRGGSG
jgi:hypothetical protein